MLMNPKCSDHFHNIGTDTNQMTTIADCAISRLLRLTGYSAIVVIRLSTDTGNWYPNS